jgi:hypothetical protein
LYKPVPAVDIIAQFIKSGVAGMLGHAYTLRPVDFATMQAAFNEAHIFNFDFADWSVDDSRHAVDFTVECLPVGLLHTPYDAMLMVWPDKPQDGEPEQTAAALLVTEVRRGTMTPCGTRIFNNAAVLGRNLLVEAYAYAAKRKSTIVRLYGFGFQNTHGLAYLQDISALDSHDSGLTIEKDASLPKRHALSLDPFKPEFSAANKSLDSAADAHITVRNACFFLGALAARKQLRTSTIAPKPAVAARRLKEGRSPWLTYTTVRLPAPASVPTGEGSVARASPRMHWRRGHIRRVNDKLIPIPPVLVGASEHGVVISNYAASRALIQKEQR